jgi:hypothetical protein
MCVCKNVCVRMTRDIILFVWIFSLEKFVLSKITIPTNSNFIEMLKFNCRCRIVAVVKKAVMAACYCVGDLYCSFLQIYMF